MKHTRINMSISFILSFIFSLCSSFGAHHLVDGGKDAPVKVGIHSMWINKGPSDESLVFPASQKGLIQNSVTRWLALNPEANTTFSFWYDGETTALDAVEATKEFFKSFLKENFSRFKLRDIRELRLVGKNRDSFDNRVPVYCRTDLLRFVIAEEFFENKEGHKFIYADLNVSPASYKYMFSPRTRHYLNKYGFVILRNDMGPASHNRGGAQGFENKFMILQNNRDLRETILKVLILPVITANEIAIRKGYHNFGPNSSFYQSWEQIIYDGIPFMFHVFLAEKLKVIKIQYSGTLADTNPLKYITVSRRMVWGNSFSFFNLKGEVLNHSSLQTSIDKSWLDYDLSPLVLSDGTKIDLVEDPEYPDAITLPTIRMIAPRSHFGI